MATEEETFRRLRRLPMGRELLNAVFPEARSIDDMNDREYLAVVLSIWKNGWRVWEFYNALNRYHHPADNAFEKDDKYIQKLLRYQKRLEIDGDIE